MRISAAVAFDENGKSLPEGEVEGGYAEPLNSMAAGEARELSFMIFLENAASVKKVDSHRLLLSEQSEHSGAN